MATPDELKAESPGSPSIGHWDVAKWLIPSVTALFIVIGYIAARGHFALLGFDPGFLGTTQYSAITAEFLGSVLESIFDSGPSWRILAMEPRLFLAWAPAWLAAVLLTYAGWRRVPSCALPGGRKDGPRLPERLERIHQRALALGRRSVMVVLALLMAVLVKGALLDAPLFKVEGALFTLADPAVPGAAPYPLRARLANEEKSAQDLKRFAAASAGHIWDQMMCMRVDKDALPPRTDLKCDATRTVHAQRTRAEFLAHMLASAAIAWLAVLLMARSEKVPVVSLAWLALMGCLTVPYAYGKLMRSSEYLFGEIALKTQVDLGGNDVNRRLLSGFEIVRDGGTATIATLRVVDCQEGRSSRVVKVWRITLGEILWQREIYRDDILGWKLVKERDDCPSNPAT